MEYSSDAGDLPSRAERKAGVLVVPTDFSPESDYALQHAVLVAQQSRKRIALVHVVKSPDDVAAAEEHMQEQLGRVEHEGVEIASRTMEGELAPAVVRVAEEVRANYVVIGTHSLKRPGLLKQSCTMKILRMGNTPYVTVQEPPRHDRIDRVVFPIDYTDENRPKYEWLEELNREFTPLFQLVTQAVNEAQLLERVEANLERAIEFIERIGGRYSTFELEGKDEFAQEIIDYTHEQEADLLVICSMKDPRQEGFYLLEPHERNLVVGGRQTPVMIINP
ncbi:MAG: hypothetical protein CSA07_02120 [Bacteroidia bacterium]|nr:MAG: hypothetical protein CSA07_02120 [Bacteroidia bacterium]